jgi:broad specificity phosphatase PhoE
MLIYLIRHPETEWNRKGIIQGHLDSKLTAKGRKTAETLGQRLKSKGISRIYSSDLGRCLETSRIVNQSLKVKIIPVRKLREQNYGKLNGRPVEEIRKKFNLGDENLVFPGGESFAQMKKRALFFVASLHSKNPVLLVTHEGVAKVVTGARIFSEKKIGLLEVGKGKIKIKR